MKNLCKTLACIELVIGTIGSIFLACTFGIRLDYHSLSLERDGAATFAIFISAMLCVITLWVILYAISELLENQEKILQLMEKKQNSESKSLKPICSPPPKSSVPATSRTSVPNSNAENGQSNNEVDDESWKVYAAWKCPNCKRINDGHVETCSCGIARPKSK